MSKEAVDHLRKKVQNTQTVIALRDLLRLEREETARLKSALAAAEGKNADLVVAAAKDRAEAIVKIDALQAHIGVLIGLLRETYGPIASIKLFNPDGDERYPQLHRKLLHKIRDAIEASTPGSDILLSARREGAEAAAKVIADHKQKQRATRIPNSASAYDTWLDYTCGELEAEIRALYPEVAPHQEKETR